MKLEMAPSMVVREPTVSLTGNLGSRRAPPSEGPHH